MIAPSGRNLYRHSSGMGTVMEFNDGQLRKVLILDAKYRSQNALNFGGNIDSRLPNYSRQLELFLNPTNTRGETNVNEAASISDEWINANVVKDANTAKYNCDVWKEYSNMSAVDYCRSIQINGASCDLPNIQTLVRIYCDANAIDSMDPSVSNNSTRALGIMNPQGAWNIGVPTGTWTGVWSSTESLTDHAWRVSYAGEVDAYGKWVKFAVIPVLELA